jgi:hypothetical protein
MQQVYKFITWRLYVAQLTNDEESLITNHFFSSYQQNWAFIEHHGLEDIWLL